MEDGCRGFFFPFFFLVYIFEIIEGDREGTKKREPYMCRRPLVLFLSKNTICFFMGFHVTMVFIYFCYNNYFFVFVLDESYCKFCYVRFFFFFLIWSRGIILKTIFLLLTMIDP
jgi:hypothetical protein